MKTALLKQRDGRVLAEIPIPGSLEDVTLNRYIDFLVECRKTEKDVSILNMTRAVSAFYGVDMDSIFSAATGAFEDRKASAWEVVMTLYGNACKIVGEFKPQIYSGKFEQVQHQGETDHIPGVVRTILANEPILPDLEVIEVIEASEAQRLFSQAVESRMSDSGEERNPNAGDPDGSYIFTMYLKILASLLRKPGERLPTNDSEREAFIAQRVHHFSTISASVALDVDFFLLNTFDSYEKSLLANTSLSLHASSLQLQVQSRGKRKSKHTNGRKTKTRKYSGESVGDT